MPCRTALAVGVLVLAGASVARAQAPSWTVNAAAFEQNMSVIASVSVGGVRLSSAGDRLAAFVGSEVRGVAVPTVVDDAHVFFLPVYANTGSEAVTFKVYDAASNTVRDLMPGVTFASNSVQGSATAPLALAPGTAGGGGGGGTPGAWVVNPADFSRTMSVVGVLRYADGSSAGVTDRVAAFVGAQVRGVATAVEVGGRAVFFLPIYSNAEGETITFKVATGTDVRAAGAALAFTSDAVLGSPEAPYGWSVPGSASGGPDVPEAWTVTPSAFDRSMNVVAALFMGGQRSSDPADRLAAFVGNEVRGLAAPQLVGGTWLTFLTVYGRTEGEAITFKAYDASSGAVEAVVETETFGTNAVLGTVTEPRALTARGASAVAEDPRAWMVTPSGFEQSMNAVGQALVGASAVAASTSRVAGFVNGQVRGVSGPTTTDGQPLFFLTVYGHTGDGAVSYKAFDGATGRVYDVAQASPFEANRVYGQVGAPLGLNTAADPVSLFVYPGDGNGDGRVNQNDLFPLSFYFGLTGPARSDASTQFRAELARTWAPADAALADMNGDGRINQNDLFALGFNFSQTRPADGFAAVPGSMAPRFSRNGGAATLRGVVPSTDLHAGDTLAVSLRLSGAGGVRAAGLALRYDTTAFTPLGRVRGALFADALTIGAALDLTKLEPGRASYAATLSGATAGVGDGEVVAFRFRVRSGATGARAFTLETAEAMDATGGRVTLTPEPISVRLVATTSTHALPLAPGWNLVSSNVQPAAPAFSNITAGASSLVLVKDLVGRVYWPELGISTLPAWERGAAYLVFMRGAGALTLTGQATVPETVPLTLPAGWNLVGYLRSSAMATATALASLGDAVVLAKDLSGRVYWPAFGINTLSALAPGDGAYLYLSRPATLTFPANGAAPSGNRQAAPPVASVRYPAPRTRTPGGAVLLVRTPGAPDGLDVAAFTEGGRLVGSGTVQGGRVLLPIQAADPQGAANEGASAGEVLRLVTWNGASEQALPLRQVRDGLTGATAVLRFQPSAVWVAEAQAFADPRARTTLDLEGPYPNPVVGRAQVRLRVANAEPVRVAVYDLAGRVQVVLHDGMLLPGALHVFDLDGAALPSGLYVLRAETPHTSVTRKLVLMH